MPKLMVIGDLHADILSYQNIMKSAGREWRKDSFDYDDFLELIDEFRCISSNSKPMASVENDGENKIIYLGDYGDRGNYPVEVYANVLLDYIENPENVVLLKGNHEDYFWNDKKWKIEAFVKPFDMDGKFSKRIFNGMGILKMLAQEVVPRLPYSALWEENYWFVHGGVPVRDVSYGTDVKRIEIENPGQDICNEMIWNDPGRESFNEINYIRGSDTNRFGYKASSDMAEELGIRTIIRAHEPDKKLKSEQGGRIVTLGSCPNSYQFMEEGGYLVIDMDDKALNGDELVKKYGRIFA